jgi:hypothetical protein
MKLIRLSHGRDEALSNLHYPSTEIAGRRFAKKLKNFAEDSLFRHGTNSLRRTVCALSPESLRGWGLNRKPGLRYFRFARESREWARISE